ncbi:MAG: hypothetical protein WAM85_01120 [Terracidiphilus sp.]
MPSSSFDIWRDWTNSVLASVRAQVESAAFRHAKIGGDACTSTLIWIRTGSSGEDNGILAVMEHAGSTQTGPGVHGLVSFLKGLPLDVREEIKNGLS